MKPTLLVLAAGMGSRYGSLKQIDGVGPNKEPIIDYSIYDAIRAGFGKVIFVIRHSFEEEFKEVFSAERFGGQIKVEYAFQELDYLPEGHVVPEGREKPWGTNHAVLMADGMIDTPFAVINGDDFYGKDGFQVLANYLQSLEGEKGKYAMVGYSLKNTLSKFGTVSRGECNVNAMGNLQTMTERTAIHRLTEEQVSADNEKLAINEIVYKDEAGYHKLNENTPVSMNLFGFTPDYIEYSKELFIEFLSDLSNHANLKSEFFIPSAVNALIKRGDATMKVLASKAEWFGVTYKEDKPEVLSRIMSLIDEGEYPLHLWK